MELCIDHDGFFKELVEDVQGQATITTSSNPGFPLKSARGWNSYSYPDFFYKDLHADKAKFENEAVEEARTFAQPKDEDEAEWSPEEWQLRAMKNGVEKFNAYKQRGNADQ